MTWIGLYLVSSLWSEMYNHFLIIQIIDFSLPSLISGGKCQPCIRTRASLHLFTRLFTADSYKGAELWVWYCWIIFSYCLWPYRMSTFLSVVLWWYNGRGAFWQLYLLTKLNCKLHWLCICLFPCGTLLSNKKRLRLWINHT